MKRDAIPKRKKLGEILVSQGKITPEKLTHFLRIQKKESKPLGEILVREGIITEEELKKNLGDDSLPNKDLT